MSGLLAPVGTLLNALLPQVQPAIPMLYPSSTSTTVVTKEPVWGGGIGLTTVTWGSAQRGEP